MPRIFLLQKLMVFFILIAVAFPVLADEKGDIDSALKKELGITEEKSKSSATAPAVDPIAERFQPEKEETSVLWLLVKVILVLGILIAAMYYALKFISVQRDAKYPVKGVMSLLSNLPIGPNKQLQIVDISGQLYVLGISDNSINLITEIKSSDAKERIYHQKEAHQTTEENFLVSLLHSVKKVHLKEKDNKEENDEKLSFDEMKKKQQDRLKKMMEEKDILNQEMNNPSLFWKS